MMGTFNFKVHGSETCTFVYARRIPPQTDHPAMPIKCARGDPKAITTYNSIKTQLNRVEICI